LRFDAVATIISIAKETNNVNNRGGICMKNLKIREAAKENGVRLWEVAEKYGISEGNFCRKLRKELPEEEQGRIIRMIDEITAEREGA